MLCPSPNGEGVGGGKGRDGGGQGEGRLNANQLALLSATNQIVKDTKANHTRVPTHLRSHSRGDGCPARLTL